MRRADEHDPTLSGASVGSDGIRRVHPAGVGFAQTREPAGASSIITGFPECLTSERVSIQSAISLYALNSVEPCVAARDVIGWPLDLSHISWRTWFADQSWIQVN